MDGPSGSSARARRARATAATRSARSRRGSATCARRGARRIWAIGAYGSNHAIATALHAPPGPRGRRDPVPATRVQLGDRELRRPDRGGRADRPPAQRGRAAVRRAAHRAPRPRCGRDAAGRRDADRHLRRRLGGVRARRADRRGRRAAAPPHRAPRRQHLHRGRAARGPRARARGRRLALAAADRPRRPRDAVAGDLAARHHRAGTSHARPRGPARWAARRDRPAGAARPARRRRARAGRGLRPDHAPGARGHRDVALGAARRRVLRQRPRRRCCASTAPASARSCSGRPSPRWCCRHHRSSACAPRPRSSSGGSGGRDHLRGAVAAGLALAGSAFAGASGARRVVARTRWARSASCSRTALMSGRQVLTARSVSTFCW